jgi:hypothetical protein
MSNVVRSAFQAASRELIAKLVKVSYLRPALRHDADAITAAIARLKHDLRSGGRPVDNPLGRPSYGIECGESPPTLHGGEAVDLADQDARLTVNS